MKHLISVKKRSIANHPERKQHSAVSGHKKRLITRVNDARSVSFRGRIVSSLAFTLPDTRVQVENKCLRTYRALGLAYAFSIRFHRLSLFLFACSPPDTQPRDFFAFLKRRDQPWAPVSFAVYTRCCIRVSQARIGMHAQVYPRDLSIRFFFAILHVAMAMVHSD